MALNYRYDKKGKVIGIGWGKGKNAKAGAKKSKANLESQQKKVRKLDEAAWKKKGIVPKSKKSTTKSRMRAKNVGIFGEKRVAALEKKHDEWTKNRAKMQKMRKENPAKYKKLKREQRKKERLKAFKAGSHTWD